MGKRKGRKAGLFDKSCEDTRARAKCKIVGSIVTKKRGCKGVNNEVEKE